jgi:hypothetical protein
VYQKLCKTLFHTACRRIPLPTLDIANILYRILAERRSRLLPSACSAETPLSCAEKESRVSIIIPRIRNKHVLFLARDWRVSRAQSNGNRVRRPSSNTLYKRCFTSLMLARNYPRYLSTHDSYVVFLCNLFKRCNTQNILPVSNTFSF